MAEEQQFCLRWNNFQVNITSQFETLRDEEDFVDVTLACEGKRLKAHKVVLSACSPYFKDLFKSNPCKHPILFMRDVEFHHLQSLVEFMYAGEVNIAQAQLSAFLRTAESLQIRGLTEAPQRHKQMDGFGSGRSGSVAGASRWGAGSPGGGSRTPSPEEAEQEGEEEMLSLSPPCSPPAKRSCQGADKLSNLDRVDDPGNHHRSHSDHYESVKSEVDIVEPKVEVPDYCSDGEGRTDNNTSTMYQGMDNSIDMTPSFQALQGSGSGGGAMDIIPGPSAQNYMGDATQDSGQADQRKLHSLDPRPCPICYRMYSNLSNLRQHLRLIHNPQTVSCPLCSKPFKTKLYLKRHLMSFHELVCTTPKAGAAVTAIKGSNAPEFFTSPQMPLGKVPQTPGDDRNGVQNSTSPAKSKDASAQELVAEFFQTRSSYQSPKGSSVGGSGFQKAKITGHNEDRTNVQTGYDVNPFNVWNQDRCQQPSHANKSQEVGNFLSPSSDNRFSVRNVSSERPVQYHSQSTSSNQDGTPPFLNLLSLTKNEENVTFESPLQSHTNDSEKDHDNTSVDNGTKTDVASA